MKTAANIKQRQEREHELWSQWSQARDGEQKKQAVEQFFDSYKPQLKAFRNKFGPTTLPEAVVDLEIANRTLDAFQTYDPTKGAKLNTWITNNMQGLWRWKSDHQNLGRIPSHRQARVGTYLESKRTLTERLGRSPSAAEIADDAFLDLDTVEALEREIRADIRLTDQNVVFMDEGDDDADLKRVVDYVYYELAPEEQVVYDYWFGKHGRPQLSGNEIADKIKKSASVVSEIKNKIRAKIDHFMTKQERRALGG